MIQEHASRMEQYLTPEERFTLAVLQDNRPVLEQMKNEGFIPSSRQLENLAANHPTASNLETLYGTSAFRCLSWSGTGHEKYE